MLLLTDIIVMRHYSFTWIWVLGLFINPSWEDTSEKAPAAIVDHQIMGKWYLRDQEMRINGKEINQHFEEMAAQVSANSEYQLDPVLLVKKFRKGFRGIPEGTVFEFKNDYSYQIVFPDKQVQQGFWKVKDEQVVVLNGSDKEMHMEIRSLEAQMAKVVIRDVSNAASSRQMQMELIIDLSR